jgi:hypothetical protein
MDISLKNTFKLFQVHTRRGDRISVRETEWLRIRNIAFSFSKTEMLLLTTVASLYSILISRYFCGRVLLN